jgi:hypothetical protein
MANILADIRKGFYDKLTTGTSSFKTAIKKTIATVDYYKLYYHLAPQVHPGTTTAVELPFVVFDILPVNEDEDSETKLHDCTVQFLVASLTVGECENIAGYITDLLEDTTLTIGAYKFIEIRRQPLMPAAQNDGVWNSTVQYSIIIQM